MLTDLYKSLIEPLHPILGELPFDILVIVLVGVVAYVLSRFITKVINRTFAGTSVGGITLFVNIARVLVAVLAVNFVGENVFHIQMDGIIQALGITSLVVSLGMQDLIKNVVAGIQIVTTRLVSVGDQIDVGDRRGEVTDINWRQTTIRDKDGDLHLIPNSELMGGTFMRRVGKMVHRHDISLDIKPGLNLTWVADDICSLADQTLEELGWKAEEPTEVRFVGSTANGVEASVRIYLSDILYTTRAMDAVVRAVGERGYLADWTNDNPAQEKWRS